MPHCTGDMRDQDDEINHEGISRRDKWWWAFTWGGFFVGTKSRLQEAAFAFRGEDSPQGNPRCRKQLSHLPTLAWRGSPQGRILPRVTLDAGSLSHLLALAWGGFSPGQTSRLDLPSSVRAVFVPLIASLPAACCPPR